MGEWSEGMPISKKRRSKAALRTSTKVSAPAALPDRRAMESFLAAIAGHRGDDATAKAQDVMYEAWERTTSRSRIALARKALGISPLCADAYEVITGPERRRCWSANDPARTTFVVPVPRLADSACPEGFADHA
jgi:hypothetical protein